MNQSSRGKVELATRKAAKMTTSLDRQITVDAAGDDAETLLPERFASNVDPKPIRQLNRHFFARARQQLFVVGHETRAALLVDRVQTDAEQQTERIREVVKRKAR